MTNSQRRLQLFNTYSTNWRLIRSRYPWTSKLDERFDEAVICPLCLALLPKEYLKQTAAVPITLEHIPPSVLGGKGRILTCKNCNNDSGRTLDHTILEFLKTQPFFALEHGATIKIKKTSVETDLGTLTSSATLTYLKGDILHFHLNIDKNESTRNDLFKKLPSATRWKGEFTFNAPSLRHVNIALLRIAYLTVFSRFGNAFILNDRYNHIRQQILNPEQEILPATGVLQTKNQLPIGIFLINQPKELAGFYVCFAVKHQKKEHRFGVFLPSPLGKRNAIEFYKELDHYKGKSVNINYDTFKDHDYLTNPDFVFSCIRAFQGQT